MYAVNICTVGDVHAFTAVLRGLNKQLHAFAPIAGSGYGAT
jgi:hypothetical protein